jgi:hypothetical protein
MYSYLLKRKFKGWMQWLMAIISAIQEAKIGRVVV